MSNEIKKHLGEKLMGWTLRDGTHWMIRSVLVCHIDDWYPDTTFEHAMECVESISLTHVVDIKVMDNYLDCRITHYGDAEAIAQASGSMEIGPAVICKAILAATGWTE